MKQMNGESLYEYWEHFNRLCASFPQHQITYQLLIQYFYEGLLSSDESTVDAVSGGALVKRTLAEAKELINNMAQDTQQFGTRENQLRRFNEISHGTSVESQPSQITNILNKLVIGGVQSAVTCNICYLKGHISNACPNLQGGMLMLCFLIRAKKIQRLF